MLSVNDRVIYEGQKATVTRVFKKTVRILTADLEKLTVAIDRLEPEPPPPPAQLTLFETPTALDRAGFSDWEVDIDEEETTPTAIDPDETDEKAFVVEFSPGDRYIWTTAIPPLVVTVWQQVAPDEVIVYSEETDAYTNAKTFDLVPVDPNPVDPNPVDPNSVDPNPVDPNPVDPNSVDPNPVDPNPVDPNRVDPNRVDPNPIDPNQDHPAKGYEEIKILKGIQYRYWRWYEGKKKRSKYLGPVNPVKSPQP
jgi:hypothetical protein